MNKILIILAFIMLTFSCDQNHGVIDHQEIKNKSLDELRIMRNEIFARHGYIFKSDDLSKYFSSYDWYAPKHDNVNHLLTEIDKANIAYIVEQEALLKSRLKNQTIEIIEKTNTVLNLELNRFKEDSANYIQTELIDIYFEQNRESVIENFKNLWGYDIKAKTYHFKILTNSIWTNKNNSFSKVKLEVKGQSEKSSGTAYNIYIFRINDDSTDLIFETSFFQPECSTPDINILSISYLKIAGKSYPTFEKESKKHACCGQASEEQIDWLIFSNNFQNQLLTLEKYFYNDNIMDCGPVNPPPPVSRKTNFYLDESGLIAEVVFFEDDKRIKSEKRKINFNE